MSSRPKEVEDEWRRLIRKGLRAGRTRPKVLDDCMIVSKRSGWKAEPESQRRAFYRMWHAVIGESDLLEGEEERKAPQYTRSQHRDAALGRASREIRRLQVLADELEAGAASDPTAYLRVKGELRQWEHRVAKLLDLDEVQLEQTIADDRVREIFLSQLRDSLHLLSWPEIYELTEACIAARDAAEEAQRTDGPAPAIVPEPDCPDWL